MDCMVLKVERVLLQFIYGNGRLVCCCWVFMVDELVVFFYWGRTFLFSLIVVAAVEG